MLSMSSCLCCLRRCDVTSLCKSFQYILLTEVWFDLVGLQVKSDQIFRQLFLKAVVTQGNPSYTILFAFTSIAQKIATFQNC